MRTKLIGNIRVGQSDTTPSAPSHTRGVHEANEPGRLEREPGIVNLNGTGARATARRSTGINAERRNPVDPGSPNLSPA
jgi:hypothetical protein